MEIEIVEMEERKCKFILKNSSPTVANALRRTMLADIPKMAIDKVEFHLGSTSRDDEPFECITPLFDEIIAHRLGMVPVPTDYNGTAPVLKFQDECECGGEGCSNCEVMYSLNKYGPCTVYSSDLMPLGNDSFKVKDDEIPIVELMNGQSILVYAHAVLGTARNHAKWQAANGVGYSYFPIIEIADGLDSETSKSIAESCPKKILEVKNGKLAVKDGGEMNCSLCKTCMEMLDGKNVGKIAVRGDDKNFIFKFETDGSLKAQQVLDKAVEILAGEVAEFKEQFKNAVESFGE